MTQLEIAKEIQSQIRAFDPFAFMAWGSKNFHALPAQKDGEKYQLGGLQFSVNGAKLKGIVCVKLMACDTYTVDFYGGYSSKLKARVLKKSIPDVYCDSLMSIIDQTIER